MPRRLQPIPWLLLAPFVMAALTFWAIPIGQGFWISLQGDELFGDVTWVGFRHYSEIWHDTRFLTAVKNTALYTALTLPIVMGFSLLIALGLRRVSKRWQGPLLFSLMLPGLTPPAVLALLYILVFNGPHGMLNALFLKPFGLPAVDWLRDPDFIKPALMLQTLWRWSGFVSLLLLSGLDGIPQQYLQIARVEGANAWQAFRKVTLPLLSPVLGFVAAFLFLDAFVLFEGSYILLGGSGGTLDSGLLTVAYTYYTAFTLGRFGSAAAMGFSLVPVLMVCTFVLVFPWKKSPRFAQSAAS